MILPSFHIVDAVTLDFDIHLPQARKELGEVTDLKAGYSFVISYSDNNLDPILKWEAFSCSLSAFARTPGDTGPVCNSKARAKGSETWAHP